MSCTNRRPQSAQSRSNATLPLKGVPLRRPSSACSNAAAVTAEAAAPRSGSGASHVVSVRDYNGIIEAQERLEQQERMDKFFEKAREKALEDARERATGSAKEGHDSVVEGLRSEVVRERDALWSRRWGFAKCPQADTAARPRSSPYFSVTRLRSTSPPSTSTPQWVPREHQRPWLVDSKLMVGQPSTTDVPLGSWLWRTNRSRSTWCRRESIMGKEEELTIQEILRQQQSRAHPTNPTSNATAVQRECSAVHPDVQTSQPCRWSPRATATERRKAPRPQSAPVSGGGHSLSLATPAKENAVKSEEGPSALRSVMGGYLTRQRDGGKEGTCEEPVTRYLESNAKAVNLSLASHMGHRTTRAEYAPLHRGPIAVAQHARDLRWRARQSAWREKVWQRTRSGAAGFVSNRNQTTVSNL